MPLHGAHIATLRNLGAACMRCADDHRYPATRAAPYIDALVGDPIVAPPELRRTAYGEPILDMPYSYHVTDQASAFPRVALDDAYARSQPDFDWLAAAPALSSSSSAVAGGVDSPRRGPVLCNFNSEWRVTPPAWAVWMNLLRRLSAGSASSSSGGGVATGGGGGATLWQVGTVDAALSNLRLEMSAAGLSPDKRLALTAKRSRADHLVSYTARAYSQHERSAHTTRDERTGWLAD